MASFSHHAPNSIQPEFSQLGRHEMPNLLYYFNHRVAPITKVLSQYDLLKSICKNLASADIIHLAATCKEHRAYITSTPDILAILQSTAHCDGRGIVAQARVFGYWAGDSSNSPAESKCLGGDAKPCTKCGAHVCNNCRFHFTYDKLVLETISESEFAELVQDEGIETLFAELPGFSIESSKAFDMFWGYRRRRTFCNAWEPLIIGFENESEICRCDLYDHFVGLRWLCLPCFFVEEAKTCGIRPHRIIAFEPGARSAVHRDVYNGVDICDCGKLSMPNSTETCRICGLVRGWYPPRKQDILDKIYAQLG